VEDLVSTGKSSLQVVEVLRQQGAEVVGMCALFTYGFPVADAAFEQAMVPLHTISNYNALMEVAESLKIVKEDDRDLLQQWRMDPANWSGLQ
ncbi:MAG: orotate phosphoribosyltransferase, partial [Bacteroidetes bacterium]|nr:orotate phosphoribosyltransferase [Bacteroidota bacterium]